MLPSYTLLYVDNARVIAAFYRALLDLDPDGHRLRVLALPL